MKILIVDDSRAMRSMIRRTLRQAGFGRHTVLEAADGLEALELIKDDRPHFILADWNMPRMNGLDLTRHSGGVHYGRTHGRQKKRGQACGRQVHCC